MVKENEILKAVARAKGGLLSTKQVAEGAGVSAGAAKALQQQLRELVRAGKLEMEGRRYRIPAAALSETIARGRESEPTPNAAKRRGRDASEPVPATAAAKRRGRDASEPVPATATTKRRGRDARTGASEYLPATTAAKGRGRDAGAGGSEYLPATTATKRRGRDAGSGASEAVPRATKRPLRDAGDLPPPEAEAPKGRGRAASAEPARLFSKARQKLLGSDSPRRGERGRPPGRKGGEVVGILSLRPEGYGFVKRLEGPPGEDVFLPPHELREAMDGDTVRIRLIQGKFGRDAGMLLEVLSHRRRSFLGVYGVRGKGAFVIPVDPTLPRFVPVAPHRGAMAGQVVKVAITSYPSDATHVLLGEIERVVGEPGDPIVEVLEVAYSHGFAEDFPSDVRAEAQTIPDRVHPADKAGRRDLSSLHLVTIDGEDARDFDDAVCVERLPRGGYRLVVAIADVAHYVRPGSALDDEARARATSVYFPNHVLPMLPERLSNGICSLNPEVERLCMVCDLALDSSGRPVEAQLYEGVMRSHARLTYEQVAKTLGGETPSGIEHLEEDLLLAGELASKLREQRTLRGALDFDLPESRAILDETMRPTAIVRRERNDAHRLIEEFMIAANEAVARHFSDRDLPTVYRVHDQPDPEKLERFANLARAVGFAFDVEEGVPPKRLGELLRQIEGSPQEKALNTLLLRSLMQAIYQPENIGHYGLASEHYLHFTSPIRRYPDLLVHRLLKDLWARAGRSPRGRIRDEIEEQLEVLAAHSSERERAAAEAERDIDQYFKCLFLRERVGDAFGATVIAVTDFGFFAELDEIPAEGLVRADELGVRWEFDEERHRLVFPGTGRAFSIGDRIRVEVAGVDLERRQVSLVLLVDQEGEAVVSLPQGGRPRRSPLAAALDARKERGGTKAPAGRAAGGRKAEAAKGKKGPPPRKRPSGGAGRGRKR